MEDISLLKRRRLENILVTRKEKLGNSKNSQLSALAEAYKIYTYIIIILLYYE